MRTVLAMAVLLGGCQSEASRYAVEERAVKEAVSAVLFDPPAARFDEVATLEQGTAKYHCGNLTAKDRLGATVRVAFAYLPTSREVIFSRSDVSRLPAQALPAECAALATARGWAS